MEFRLDYYHRADNSCPMDEFLDSLELQMKDDTLRNLDRLKKRGNKAREPLSKKVSKNIFECRTKSVDGITRVFFFFTVSRLIICTHGYVKKTQKTSPEEIQKAENIRLLYLERKENSHG